MPIAGHSITAGAIRRWVGGAAEQPGAAQRHSARSLPCSRISSGLAGSTALNPQPQMIHSTQMCAAERTSVANDLRSTPARFKWLRRSVRHPRIAGAGRLPTFGANVTDIEKSSAETFAREPLPGLGPANVSPGGNESMLTRAIGREKNLCLAFCPPTIACSASQADRNDHRRDQGCGQKKARENGPQGRVCET